MRSPDHYRAKAAELWAAAAATTDITAKDIFTAMALAFETVAARAELAVDAASAILARPRKDE
jgi:hypothetical protein